MSAISHVVGTAAGVFSREVTVAAILICLVIVTSPPIKYALNLGKLLNVVILILR